MDDTQKTLPPSSPTPNPSKDPQSTLDDILSQLEEQYKKEMDHGAPQEKIPEEKKESAPVPTPVPVHVVTPLPSSSPSPAVLKKAVDVTLSAPKTEPTKTESLGENLHVVSSTTPHIEEHPLPHSTALDAAQKKVAVEPIGNVVKPTTNTESSVVKTMHEDGTQPKKVEPLPAGDQSAEQKTMSPLGRIVKKAGIAKIVLGVVALLVLGGGFFSSKYLLSQNQDSRKYADAGWCEIRGAGCANSDPSSCSDNVVLGWAPCETSNVTERNSDGAPVVHSDQKTFEEVRKDVVVDTGLSNTDFMKQAEEAAKKAASENKVFEVNTQGQTTLGDGKPGDSAGTGSGTGGGSGTGTGTGTGGTPVGGADTRCTAAEQKDCGDANQGYCVCGASKEKLCKGNYTPLGGDCVPAGTKEAVTGKPGDTGTHCQSNSGCADGLECSGHVCQEKSKVQPTSVADTGVGRGAQGACWCQEKGLVCTNNGKAQWMGPVGECTDPKNDGKSAGKILNFSSSNAVNERVGVNEAKYGTGSLEILTPGGGPSGYQVKDLVAGQTIGNMCNNAAYSGNKPCDWEKGYYDAKKSENFGKLATQPEYTNSIGHDLDGDSSNGYQIGKIEYDPLTKQFVIRTAYTLNTTTMKIDPASVFTVSQNADGTASLTRVASSGGSGSSGTLSPDWIARAKNGQCNSPTMEIVTNSSGLMSGYKFTNDAANSKHDLLCEPVNGMPAFCVPNGWLGSKGCDQYVLDGGGALRYGGNAVFTAGACNGTKDRNGIITCDTESPYWQCSPYEHENSKPGQPGSNVVTVTEVTHFKCYEKDPAKRLSAPPNAPFTVNGDCITSKGGVIAGYYCQGSGEANRSLGCNDSVAVAAKNNGTICANDIAAASNICGVIQIDGDGVGTDGEYYHYSINVASTNGCGSGPKIPTPPIVQMSCLPGQCGGTTSTCTENCGTTPSPPPPGSPVCVDITTSIAAPTIGQAPVFTCSPASEATRYEFRYKIGSGAYSAITPASTNSNVSTPLTVNASGVYTVQCRPCNANGCSNWDNL